jgi:ubiquinone/menaquinone biosynthesis C-methylase UbiE
VLDVGCGPGTDLPALAQAVSASGSVIGVDLRSRLVEEASRRVAGTPWVEVRVGDAHRLPVDTRGVDRARADRMVQHVANPAGVFAELYRVLRPAGLAVVSEPDWDSLVIDPGNAATNRAFTHFLCTERIRNATIGRQLARLAEAAGFEVSEVITTAPTVRDFELANKVLKLSTEMERAIRAGHVERAAGERWLAELADGPFTAAMLLFVAVVRRPA